MTKRNIFELISWNFKKSILNVFDRDVAVTVEQIKESYCIGLIFSANRIIVIIQAVKIP